MELQAHHGYWSCSFTSVFYRSTGTGTGSPLAYTYGPAR